MKAEETRMVELWRIMDVSEAVDTILNWGYGSGEELYEFLREGGLSDEEAHTVMELLGRAAENVQRKCERISQELEEKHGCTEPKRYRVVLELLGEQYMALKDVLVELEDQIGELDEEELERLGYK